MTFGIARLSKTFVIALLVMAAVVAVAIPVAYRARRARWTAELGSMARERRAAGNVDEAIRLYGEYLRRAPNDAAAHAAFATLLREQAELPVSGRREREAALRAINDALRRNPESLPLRRMLALTLLELGQFGTARQELVTLREQAAAATPETLSAAAIDLDEITLLEARVCLANDMVSDAASLAARLTGFDPAGKTFDSGWQPGRFVTEASILQATILSGKSEDPEAAERVLEKLTETAPDDHRAWLAMARWHAGHGEPRRAAEQMARAAAIAPDSRDVLATGFAFALADRRFDEAARLARRIGDLFPGLPDGGLSLAEVALRQNKPAEALPPLESALERLPDNPGVLLALANAQLLANRLDDADRTIHGLAERSEGGGAAVGMLEARLLVAKRQWLAAVKKLDALRPLVAGSGDAKRQVDLLLAECHGNLGQPDEQLAASRRAFSRDSNALASRVASAAALAASGKSEKALAEYESIAREIGQDRLVREPQIWRPLLRLRGVHQLRLPAKDRDWSQVVHLLDDVQRSKSAPESVVAVLRYDHLVAAGDPTAGDFLTRALDAHADEPQLWERLVLATFRQQGLSAALQRLGSLPTGVADAPSLLVLRVTLAAGAPEKEAEEILSGIEAKTASLPAEQSRQVLAVVASVRARRGDRPGAERVWRAIIAANPDDLPTHLALFEQACDERDLTKAGLVADEICGLVGADSANGRAVKAARLMLEVADGRLPSGSSEGGRPARTGPLSAEDVARLDAARNMLVEAESERPGWPLLQRLGADLELIRGDVPAAIARLEKAVALSPENLQFIRPLVALLAGSNRQARAREVVRQIIDANGDAIASDDLRGWARRTLAELAVRDGTFAEVEEAVGGLARNQDRDGKPALQDVSLGIALLAGRPEPAAWRLATRGWATLADRRPLTISERMQRATLLDRLGDWEGCRADVEELASQPESPPVVLAAAAEMLIRHGDVERATSCLKTLAGREPSAAGVIILEFRLALAQGDRAAAVEVARRLARSDPDSAEGSRRLFAAVALLEECGQNDEADALSARLAEQVVAGVLARADFLARRGRTAEALDMLQANRQRLGTGPVLQAAVSAMRKADAETSAEQFGRVGHWLTSAQGSGNDGIAFQDSEARTLLQAELAAAMGRHEESAALYRKQLERRDLQPSERAILLNNLAMQLMRRETAEEARQLVEEAIALQGPHPSLLDTKGLALLAGGASREAVDVLREASLDRSSEKCLHLACALVAAGDPGQAREVLLVARKNGLDRRVLDAEDRKRLAEVEEAIGLPVPGS